ncbi:HAMP domain-containing sensor histidine kinase [Trichocoleus sp. FACHB-262]|uniref:sensor histidine kinase n=1 Tax=Trichocoleus sp. FACHB-262 TaxID=2692869 RepID=UPI001683529A|nr:sensor histidine kinase [Trichocoleus sp. FACHB-262]MBD2122483.1 sensor histidine kinase [Trichocoleus sp. FACHB-262]
MVDFGQLLTDKIEIIEQNWVSAVRQDSQIEIAQELTYKALRNSFPKVLQAMASILSNDGEGDLQKLVESSLEHGIVRAEQGFDPAEIAREYRLLRTVIFETLEPGLLQSSPKELLRAVRLIDTVIDEAIARCFKSYTHGRLKELEQLQTQLKLTNQELTRLVRASKENLSHLAHELKTPLTSIIGYSDLFLRKHRQPEEDKDNYQELEHIERILRSGRQLLHLINDALEISRYDAGRMKLHLAPIQIRGIIQQTIEIVEPLARSKELQLVVDCDRAPEEVVTDALRLQQVLMNLLSNAIRYTETGSIHITCETQPNQTWAIAISDTGVGIEPDNQTQVFDPYFRVMPNNQSYLSNSTGLGLAIVARLVKLLQGEVELASQVGVGSTFTVTLPLEVKPAEGMLPQELSLHSE